MLTAIIEQRIIVKFHFKLGKTTTETYISLKKVYGTECLPHKHVSEWFIRFQHGQEDVEDDELQDLPTTLRSIEKIDIESSSSTEPFMRKYYKIDNETVSANFSENIVTEELLITPDVKPELNHIPSSLNEIEFEDDYAESAIDPFETVNASEDLKIIEETSEESDSDNDSDRWFPYMWWDVPRIHKKRRMKKSERAEGGKVYMCEFCGVRFVRSDHLLTHIKRHSNVKTFKCRYCEKHFYTHPELISHHRIHTGEKPYKCKHCPLVFSYRSTRSSHERACKQKK